MLPLRNCQHCGDPLWRDPFDGETCPTTKKLMSDPGDRVVDSNEQTLIIETFTRMLRDATMDGAVKRQRGTKPPWWCDASHEAAIFSHLNKWKHGELVDADSGAHPLVHLAWRCLAIAYQETHGKVNPEKK